MFSTAVPSADVHTLLVHAMSLRKIQSEWAMISLRSLTCNASWKDKPYEFAHHPERLYLSCGIYSISCANCDIVSSYIFLSFFRASSTTHITLSKHNSLTLLYIFIHSHIPESVFANLLGDNWSHSMYITNPSPKEQQQTFYLHECSRILLTTNMLSGATSITASPWRCLRQPTAAIS